MLHYINLCKNKLFCFVCSIFDTSQIVVCDLKLCVKDTIVYLVFLFAAGQEILLELEKEKVLVFTPARRVCGKRIICYDDRYIIKLAAENGGVVVSNDNYRDLINESTSYKKVIEERLLMYSFVNDRFVATQLYSGW